jgi:hypothetical protein
VSPQRKTELTEEHVRLILDYASTVPHLEVLLLLWENAPNAWTTEQIAKRIYTSTDAVIALLRDLRRNGLVLEDATGAARLTEDEALLQVASQIALAYRDNVSRVAGLIHSGPPKALRDFARAFRIKGDD